SFRLSREEGDRGTQGVARRVSRPARPRPWRGEREEVAAQPPAVHKEQVKSFLGGCCCLQLLRSVRNLTATNQSRGFSFRVEGDRGTKDTARRVTRPARPRSW
ncbi:unnamed protein product, partial [Ectocarpus sp. 8 AP-2014]